MKEKKTNIKRELCRAIRKRKTESGNTGITLISLIITIIILLILAGVSINFIFGNEGIFSKTQTAVKQYQNTQDMEQTQIDKYSNKINSYINGYREYEPINFSYDEQNTKQKFADGKDIYVKTFKITSLPSANWTSISHNISHIDTLIDSFGAIYVSNINSQQFWANVGMATSGGDVWSTYVLVDDSNIRVYLGDNLSFVSEKTGYVTLYYTK